MIGGSIPKLLQIAGETKEALGKISADLPADVSVAEITAKIDDLEAAISALDALNAERTRQVNVKGDKAGVGGYFQNDVLAERSDGQRGPVVTGFRCCRIELNRIHYKEKNTGNDNCLDRVHEIPVQPARL
ncbi:MAG: hypothetical protein D3908_13950 [Candidatus Electrothrix sp. AUS4]|nr:hypothetical protein [Candidatus Electrothrix sp. AUS4]